MLYLSIILFILCKYYCYLLKESIMSDQKEDIKPVTPYVTPKPIKMIQDFLGPINTLYLAPASVAVVFDLLSPWGPFLLIASIITGLFVLYSIIFRNKLNAKGQKLTKSKMFAFGLLAFLVFSGSATANFSHKDEGGVLANWVPNIKKWQDAYLVSIKKDTEEINKKVDKTNALLAQMLDGWRPQLEKPLVEEIPQYAKLKTNEKNALLLFTKKVGTNGIKKYKGLIKATNNYIENPTSEKALEVADHFKYVVRVNGKDIEDTKTKKLIMSLFLSPETYDYLMGIGSVPEDTALLDKFNIDISKPVEGQLEDPLGDYLKKMELENGIIPEQQVVIPKEEKVGEKSKLDGAPVKKKNVNQISSSHRFI